MKLLYRYLLFIFAGILLLVASNTRWGGNNWKGTILSDGQGYYAYLPGVFIYNDLQFTFTDSIGKKYYDTGYTRFRLAIGEKMANKYYAGTALAITPFFLAGHAAAQLTGHPADGYSKPYNIAVYVAAIFYLLMGLWFIRKLLRSYDATEWQTIIILSSTAFGTNAFYYALGEPAMSHVYSLAFTSMFLWHAHSWFLNGRQKHLMLLAAALGMIVLIRPINGIIILSLPFIAGNMQTLKSGITNIFKNIPALLAAVLIAGAIASIQLIIYKIQTGHFFIYSYGEEGFNWSDPHMLDFLVSYKKGLFVYTPLCLLALPGFIGLGRENGFAALSLFIFMVLLVYVLSSWWNWWYGGSFSTRVFIEYLPFIAILLLFAMKMLRARIARGAFTALVVIVVVLCQLQTYQYRYNIIHWEDMTREKYWEVFLRLKK
jgi:hypothetical protein